MNGWKPKRLICRGAAAGLGILPAALQACTACYGQSDSPMAQGMNWGILSLLVVIGFVLAGVASFFVYLGWRSSARGPAASEDWTATEN